MFFLLFPILTEIEPERTIENQALRTKGFLEQSGTMDYNVNLYFWNSRMSCFLFLIIFEYCNLGSYAAGSYFAMTSSPNCDNLFTVRIHQKYVFFIVPDTHRD